MRRKVLIYARMLFFVFAGLILAVFLWVWSGIGVNQFIQWSTARLGLFEDATLKIGHARGNLFGSLYAGDITLQNSDGLSMVEIENLSVQYAFFEILRGSIHLKEIHAVNPVVRMNQSENGSWDVIDAITKPSSGTQKSKEGETPILIDKTAITHIDITANCFNPSVDSTYRLQRFDVIVGNMARRDGIRAEIADLSGTIWLPNRSDSVFVEIRAAFSKEILQFEKLRVTSLQSDLHGSGRIALPFNDSLLQHNQFTLNADPLSFDDIRIFLPGLTPGESADLSIEADGASGSLKGSATINFSDGASFNAHTQVQAEPDRPRRYVLEAKSTQFNPHLLGVAKLPRGSINLDLQVDLQGASIKELSGFANIEVIGSNIAGINLDSTLISSRWTKGRARLEGLLGIDASVMTLEGITVPFADTLSYDVTGTLRDLDIQAFLERGYSTSIDANWQIAGRGKSINDAVTKATAQIRLQPSRVNRLYLESGNLTGTVQNRRILFDALLNMPSGTIKSKANIKTGGQWIVESSQTDFADFDIAALMGDTTRSSINGSLAASMEFAEDISATWTLDLSDTRYGSYLLRNSLTEGQIKNQTISISSSTNLDGGNVSLDAELYFDDDLTYTIKTGTVSNLDLGQITGNPSIRSELNGTFSARGTGSTFSTMRSSGQIRLASSRLNDQRIRQAETSLSLSSDTLLVDLDIDLPEGEAKLTGRIASLSSRPEYLLTGGTFSGLDVGPILGDTTLSSSLNGSLSLDGAGFSPPGMRINSYLDLRESSWNDAGIKRGTSFLTLEDGFGQLRSSFEIDSGSVNLTADLRSLDEEVDYRFNASVSQLDLANLFGRDSLRSRLNFTVQGEGRGMDLRTMQLGGRLRVQRTTYDRFSIETADLAFNLNQGTMEFDTVHVVSNLADLAGEGPIALIGGDNRSISDFNFTAMLKDLSPLAPFLDSDQLGIIGGELRGRVYGEDDMLRFDSRINSTGLLFNDVRIGDTRIRMTGELTPEWTLSVAEVAGSFETASVPGIVLEEVRFESLYSEQEVSFDVDIDIDRDHHAQFAGSTFFQESRRLIQFNTFNVKLDRDQWKLRHPASLTLGTPLKIDDFQLLVGDPSSDPAQLIAIDGIIDPEGPQNMTLDIRNFRMGAVAELAGFEGLDGPLNLQVTVLGEATAPQIEGLLHMNIISYDEEAGDFTLALDYDSLKLNIDAAMRHVSGQELTADGFFPIDLSLATPEQTTTGARLVQSVEMKGDVDFRIRSDSLAIDWLLLFVDNAIVNRLDGVLEADIYVTGTASDPQLAGSGRLYNGAIRSPMLDITYRNVQADLALQDNIIRIENMTAQAGEGRLNLAGHVQLTNLTDAELGITIHADQFTAIDTREYRAVLSGDLDLTGRLLEPVLTGDIRLLSTDIYYSGTSGPDQDYLNVQLTEEDLLMLEREFGFRPTASDTTTFDFYEALKMDVDMVLERDTWIRSKSNPEMNVQFNGVLDLIKDPRQKQEIYGSIEVNPDRSYITQFGKRFDIVQGTITFNGPATDPMLSFQALYEVPSRRSRDNAVTVYLDIEGTMETIDFTLRSEPAMELTDIVSYVVTGQPASEALQLGGLGNQAAESFAVTQGVGLLSGAIETLVQNSGLELDVIQIEPLTNARGATITAGKYVTPHIFTAVSQPIGASDVDGTSEESGTVITLELELLNSLLLRLLGGESVMQINLLWHHAY